jgi:glutaredoxin
MKYFLMVTLLLLVGLSFTPIQAAEVSDKQLDVFIFTSTGCPFCAKAIDHLEKVKQSTYPNLEINEFDLRKNPTFYEMYTDYANAYSMDTDSVPVTYIGEVATKGFDADRIDFALNKCATGECPNPGEIVTQYLKDNPRQNDSGDKSRTIFGWVIVGALIVGGGLILLNRK